MVQNREEKSEGGNQCEGKMISRSDIKTASNRGEKRKARFSKLRSNLLFLCTCFKSCGKQRRDMIAEANRGQIEAISETAL